MRGIRGSSIVFWLCFFLLFSCSESPAPEMPPLGGGAGEVLVWVDENPITRLDLEDALKRLEAAGLKEEEGSLKAKVLESLIQTKAMAQARLKEMDAEEKARLDRQVAAHREELLAKAFLLRHATPEGVTEQQARAYYAAHPEAFGGGVLRVYGLVMGEDSGGMQGRSRVVQALEGFSGVEDWQARTEALRKEGLDLIHMEDREDLALYPASIRSLGASLDLGEETAVFFHGGRAWRMRLSEEVQRSARPFGEVHAEISGLLSPVQVKAAVAQAAKAAMDRADIRHARKDG